ncbi:MAG: response regulator [Marinilabiliaceae bacterium]|nr:response regulator [Marinilabiliaceae bacterium]
MKKILIADDAAESIIIMKLLLRHFPVQIIEAQDGNEAWEKIGKYQPDLSFLDIHMPFKDGLNILRDLKEQGNTMPVAITSNNREQFIIDSCINLGALSYLKKPFGLRELNRVLQVLGLSAKIY